MVETLAWIVVVLLALTAATTVVLWRALDRLGARVRESAGRLPGMIVVRPVRGLDPGLSANVAAALAQRYPGASGRNAGRLRSVTASQGRAFACPCRWRTCCVIGS